MSSTANPPVKNTPSKFVHIYKWTAPHRYWSPRDKNWYLGYSVFYTVIIFLAALTEQYLLILALIALLLLIFVQASIPPEIHSYEITNRGLKAYDTLFRWRDIEHFWVTEKVEGGMLTRINKLNDKYRMIHLDLPTKVPPRLTILVGNGDEQELVFHLLEYIPYADPEETSDDFLTQAMHGRYIKLHEYADTEEFAEAAEQPQETIAVKEETEPEIDPEALAAREEKRKKQLSELQAAKDETTPTK